MAHDWSAKNVSRGTIYYQKTRYLSLHDSLRTHNFCLSGAQCVLAIVKFDSDTLDKKRNIYSINKRSSRLMISTIWYDTMNYHARPSGFERIEFRQHCLQSVVNSESRFRVHRFTMNQQ